MRFSPRLLIRPLACAGVLSLALLPIAGCGGKSDTNTNTATAPSQAAPPEVSIVEKKGPPDSYAFGAATVKVTKGGSLVIENKTDEDHSIVCKPDAGIGAMKIESEKEKTATFATAGTFTCSSTEHPEATIVVTVS